MIPPYLGWSKERGFYYDPDGAYMHRSDALVLLTKLDACTEAHALTAQRAESAEQQLTAARADTLAHFQERLTAKFTPALNTGTALDALALMGEVIREMSLLHLPQEPQK